jgi:serine protease Do/serine protease DegQ
MKAALPLSIGMAAMSRVHLALPLSLALALLAAPVVPALAALPSAVGETPVPSLSPMIKRVSPAVVNISTQGTIKQKQPSQNPLLDDPFYRRFFDMPELGPKKFQSAGSGVIFDAKNGYIVTNAHVIESASEITVTLQDGHDLKAEVVGTDVRTDVAVLKVKSEKLSQVALGDSAKIEVGDFVVAIGNPFGLSHTVTSGIVSALSRSGITADGLEDYIQTDASINPGNSGGALVNLNGELIGINTAIYSRSGGNIGIGFAIPVNMARNIIDQLVKFGAVKRGVLGITIDDVSPDIAQLYGLKEAQGALITQVVEGSAAEKAGIRIGDVVVSVNDRPVKSRNELRLAISQLRAGQTVRVGVVRDGKPSQVSATIPEVAADTPPTAKETTPQESNEIHTGFDGAALADAPDEGGAVVRSVDPGSPAAQNSLRGGDIIIGVNRGKVTTLSQLRERAKDAPTLVLEVRRGNRILLVPLRSP